MVPATPKVKSPVRAQICGLTDAAALPETGGNVRLCMAKIIATTFGAVLILFGLGAFASPYVLGTHCSPLGNLLNMLVGAMVLLVAQTRGPAWMFWGCVGAAAFYLLWGMAGYLFGQPSASTLTAMPPDLRLLVVIPGFLESGSNDHVLHLFFGIALGIAAAVGVSETPFRLRK
jgi:hypothetical protein